MKLTTLIRTAAKAYEDGNTKHSWDGLFTRGGQYTPNINIEGGNDTLVKFIIQELRDTFDPIASREEQLEDAMTAMETAAKQLQDVADAFYHASVKRGSK